MHHDSRLDTPACPLELDRVEVLAQFQVDLDVVEISALRTPTSLQILGVCTMSSRADAFKFV